MVIEGGWDGLYLHRRWGAHFVLLFFVFFFFPSVVYGRIYWCINYIRLASWEKYGFSRMNGSVGSMGAHFCSFAHFFECVYGRIYWCIDWIELAPWVEIRILDE